MSRITYRCLTVSDFAHILWNFTGKGVGSKYVQLGIGGCPQEADPAANWLPDMVRAGWGVSEVTAAFVATVAHDA